MFAREGRKIYVTCDHCHKREFVRDLTGDDLIKMKVDFPKGWSAYKEENETKLVFCSNSKCQSDLAKLNKDANRRADNRLQKENWSKQLINE